VRVQFPPLELPYPQRHTLGVSGLSKAALIPRAFLRDGHMFTCCVRDPA
jgi:hypothetical protein